MNKSQEFPGITLFFFLFSVFASAGFSADWPMWRCDAARSASTTEELAPELHLQWVRQYPAFQKAWTIEGSEMVYSPIVLGKTMFVGSPINDRLTAIDIETGEEKWRFYTEGPIRLAPAGWKNRVFVTSDDGFLYCVDAAKGTLVWKFRGAPRSKGTGLALKHRVIGDERLVSAWPARGGAVVATSADTGKATVYFAASIYPFMGVYIYAIDVETGKAVWVNDRRGARWQWGGGEKTAPQGPLTVVGNKLLIPNNRIGTTCLNLETGKFVHAVTTRTGWNVCGVGKYFFASYYNRGHRAYVHDLETGRVLGNTSSFPVLSGEILLQAAGDDNRALVGGLDLSKLEDATVKKRKPLVKIPSVWKLDKFKKVGRAGLRPWLKAGPRMYVSDGNRIVAIDIPSEGKEATESWVGSVKGVVGDMLAAAGRLFVVTREGGLYCFGAEKTELKTYSVKHKDLPPVPDADAVKAKQILTATGVKDGYAIIAGIGTGNLVEAFLKQSELMLIVVDPDAVKVDALRRRLDTAGLYGKRAMVIAGDPFDCGLPKYVANLIVCEDPKMRPPLSSLKPYRGVACLAADKTVAEGWAKEAKLEKVELKQAEGFTLLTRAGALPGSAPWTHQYADPGNSVCSKDDLVKAPLGLLWFGGSSSRLSFDRHHFGPRPHVVGGRMFVFGPDGLTAIDAYTGRRLWRVNSPEVLKLRKPYQHRAYRLPGSNFMGSYYASVADGVYVATGKTCMRLDPATGKKLSEITLPADEENQKHAFGPIRIWQDVLVALVDPIIDDEKLFGTNKWNGAASRQIAAFDRNTGKALWSIKAEQGFCHNAIAAGAGMVFCIDRWAKDAKSKAEGGKLLALDVRTGKVVWSTTENVYGTWVSYSPDTGLVLQGAGMRGYKNPNGSRGIAYQAKDGKVTWDLKIGGGPWMLNGNMLIAQGRSAFDLRTGKRTKKFGSVGGKSCDYDICGTHVITNREGSSAYVDIDTNTPYRLGGMRSGCMNTLIPADGVLSYPFFAKNCGCGVNVRASLALIHMPELAAPTEKDKK